VAAFVSAVTFPSAASPSRILDDAFRAANKAACQVRESNPSVGDVLISTTAILLARDVVQIASVGANSVLLREGGKSRSVVEPETMAAKLVDEGITADPLPEQDGGSSPSNGLGLPGDLFALRQNVSLTRSEGAMVVVCGGRMAPHVTPSHVDTTSPSGAPSKVASRLYKQLSGRLDAHSTIAAVHWSASSASAEPAEIESGDEDLHGTPGNRWTIAGVAAIVVLLVAGLLFFLSRGDGPKDRPASSSDVPAPAALLPPKAQNSPRSPCDLLDTYAPDVSPEAPERHSSH